MKRHWVLIVTLLITSISLLSSNIYPVHAQDAPNINVTKRRPDRSPGLSPTPMTSPPGFVTQPDVKQVQTDQTSFFSVLWARISAFFGKLFELPKASTTTATP